MEKTEVQRMEDSKKVMRITSIVITLCCAYLLGYAGYCASLNEDSFLTAISDVIALLEQGKFLYFPTITSVKYALWSPVIGTLIYWGISNDYRKNQSAKRGTESGTARFRSEKELIKYNKEFITPDPPVIVPSEERPVIEYDPDNDSKMYSQNFIMSQKFCRPCNLRSHGIIGNNNILIVGGAGTGKSRFVMKPNLLQMNCSYIVTDPSGEMIESVGAVLRDHGYKIKIFNISDMEHSNCYNPLDYIRDEAGVDMLIECLINNTTKGEGGGDNQFFVDAEKLLYSACIFYLKDFCNDVSKKNFASIMRMINASKVDENNPNAKSKLDRMFEEIPQDSLAATRYRAFKQAAGKTLKSIIISCVVRLRPFMTPQVINLTSSDSLDLSKIGYEKTALFIITPQADRTYAFLASMLYSQLFETLYHEGEERKAAGESEELPIPVRCMMDEFANIGEVPEFPSKLATMRKYNISATIVLQDIAQIEAMYQDNWKTLVGNCSTFIFLGTQEPNTLKYFSELLGTYTIRVKSENRSDGPRGNASRGYQPTARQLMTTDELGRMPSDECIVYTQNEYPVHDKKYDYEKHPYYGWTGDADKKYSYLYKQMRVYDNTRQNQMKNMLRGVAEAKRIRNSESKNSNIKKPKIVNVNEVKLSDTVRHLVAFDDETEKHIFYTCVTRCTMAGAENVQDGLCVINVEGIPPKYMNRISQQVAAVLGVPKLLLFTNDDNMFRCVAYGRSEDDQNQLFDAMHSDYAAKVARRKNDPCIVTAIQSKNFESYVKDIKEKIS